MPDLKSLMDHVARVWICDAERYPELKGMNADQRQNFLLKHSILHINKTAGKLAAACEHFDHEGVRREEDAAALKDSAVKMFVNAVKLAEEAGLTADDLLEQAPRYVK